MVRIQVDGKSVVLRSGDITSDEMAMARASGKICWDIETSGLSWQTDRMGTCQLDVGYDHVVIVDVSRKVPVRLRSLLQEDGVIKVFHHAVFDLRFMCFNWEVESRNIVCTKIASKLLDRENSENHTLEHLVRRYLGGKLDKGERVSNWLAPELRREQLVYAAKDVIYLRPLLTELEHRLELEGLLSLAKECFRHIPTRVELDIEGYPDVYQY
jgi:ribonuclease D